MVRPSDTARPYLIGDQPITLEAVRQSLHEAVHLELTPMTEQRVQRCRRYLDEKLRQNDRAYYGINTGFGFLQHVRIDASQIVELQHNLLRSHASGTGSLVPQPIVGLMLLLKVASLAQGYSGVELTTVQRLIDHYNAGYFPVVYQLGSLGASGDLAPLAHLSLPLIGQGELRDHSGQIYPARAILDQYGWQPLILRSKEGLALINGTQFMSAYGLYCLERAEYLATAADWIAALSCDAFACRTEPFHPAIHRIRPHPGQVKTADRLWRLLSASPLANTAKQQVQDPYSFRCIPQVHGASKDVFAYTLDVFLREVNSVTDNPSIFPEEDLILSGGNFHGQPLALALDAFAMALAELGSISERRTFQLISGQRELPNFLVNNPGLHSGLMIPQYTAASIVSQNKQLCTPASVDSIVSSNGQEDHVSMGANAATKCLQVLENVERILSIELLTATQALEFRRPAQTAPLLEELVAAYRQHVPFVTADRVMSADIEAGIKFLQDFKFSDYENDCNG